MPILAPLLLSLAISFLVTPVVLLLAKKLNIMDDPKSRTHPATLHRRPVARGGGIPIFISLVIASLVFLPLSKTLLAILLGASLILLIGLVDDRKSISPTIRLIVNVAAAGIVVWSGVVISFLTNPTGGIINFAGLELLGLPLLSVLLTIVWIVFMTNIVSWSSGVDGQLSGFVPIAAAALGGLSLRFGEDITQWPVIILSAIVAGSYLGLLFWSSYPQRVMPGYSGGALAGFLLGLLAILSGAKLATIVIVLGIPVIDATLVIARRLLSGKSPVKPDTRHLHHKLLKIGWSKRKIAIFYWTITAILGFVVLHLNSQTKFYTIIMLFLLVGGLLTWLTFGPLSARRDRPTG